MLFHLKPLTLQRFIYYFIKFMNKKILMPLLAAIGILLAGVVILSVSLGKQKQANDEMRELAEHDKQEMENEYEQFTRQYSEMMTQINNDSIVAQLTQEQMRTQQLLEELKKVKSDNAREITRLKKELATVRAVLRSYVLQIDSLNRLNENLTAENASLKAEQREANRQIEGLSNEKESLSEKVAIAAQLDATNIVLTAKKKRGRTAKYIKDAKSLELSFTVTKNVTATNGVRTFYVRITSPTGAVVGKLGSFAYEDRNIDYSMKKDVEYTGEELNITMFMEINQFLGGGDYVVSIFADGNMIGSRTFTYKK